MLFDVAEEACKVVLHIRSPKSDAFVEFDMEKFIKVKLNDQCEFPLELDMLNYTQEGVARKAAVAKAKSDA